MLIEKNINESFIQENRKRKKYNIYKQNNQFFEAMEPGAKCDLNSPFCYFNNCFNDINKFSEIKIFKLKQNTKKYENYFFDKFKENDGGNDNNNTIKIENDISNNNFNDILIERMEHVCLKEKNKDKVIEIKKE